MTNFTLFFPLSKNLRFIFNWQRCEAHKQIYFTSKTVLGSLSKLMIHLLPTQPKIIQMIYILSNFQWMEHGKKLIQLTASDKLCAGRPAKSKYLHLMLSPWLGAWTGSLTCFVRPSPLLHFPLQNFNVQYERTDLPMSPTTIRGTSTWKNRFNLTILITH